MVSGKPHRVAVFIGLLLLVAPLISCKKPAPVDPMFEAVAKYKEAVGPPIQNSEQISKVFVQIVLDEKGAPNPDRAVKRIEEKVLPGAREFLEAVKGIETPEQRIADVHQYIVQVAQLRWVGYNAIVKGYNTNDMEMFNAGHKKITESKIQENTYVDLANRLLRSYGQKLSYYAPGSADPFAP